jgi:hypothetical protein
MYCTASISFALIFRYISFPPGLSLTISNFGGNSGSCVSLSSRLSSMAINFGRDDHLWKSASSGISPGATNFTGFWLTRGYKIILERIDIF